ncbi:hypothetical protein M422DRAFT_275396 [Sphaerobolus stellatus SS14]|uniref:Uncharacterized protein n=1 Tax=Sphaerobolus stellatus (strain SS14) TaxID=990650 RepID=A0A0C9UFK2_SPHS4|nr:hypothetical protein M422DRAFT_275396 [Sphaerobolus stellatus SS14]
MSNHYPQDYSSFCGDYYMDSPSPTGSTSPMPLPMVGNHMISEVHTGQDEASNMYIHRLTDEEKRRCSSSYPSTRPTFCCKLQGCRNPWLQHRGLIKTHLMEHGLQFPKPFRCSCGADFGRQVEAVRHLDDKKPCTYCQRPGRKYKNTSICTRCHRQT